MSWSEQNTLEKLTSNLTKTARRYDRSFTAIEYASTALGAISLATGGALFGSHAKTGLAFLFAGAILTLISIRLNFIRTRGILEHTALAMSATAEAKIAIAHQEALARKLADAIATGNTAEQRVISAESRVTELGVQLHKERSLSEARNAHRQLMLITFRDMHEAAEAADPNMPLKQVIEAMLDASYLGIVGVFGCLPSERWTFSIFSLEDRNGTEVLIRTFARSQDEKEARDRRVWERGEGYTGAAWATGREVIESDTSDPDVTGKYVVPPDKQLPEDLALYASVAAIPIKIGDKRPGKGHVCGVITATSDCKGRFLRNQSHPRAQNVEFLHAIERIIALQIVLRSHSSNGAFKLP